MDRCCRLTDDFREYSILDHDVEAGVVKVSVAPEGSTLWVFPEDLVFHPRNRISGSFEALEFDPVFGLLPSGLRKAWAAPAARTPYSPPAPPAVVTQFFEDLAMPGQPSADLEAAGSDDVAAGPAEPLLGEKKHKKVKRGPRKPKVAPLSPPEPPARIKTPKSVSFGQVSARLLPRLVGGGGVPGGGGWPLGIDHSLSPAAAVDVTLGHVDDFEQRRAVEIEERIRSLSKKERKAANGETRQFSHRSDADNPLFKRMCESERRELLSREADHRSDLAQLNLNELAELQAIRQSREVVGCSCHPISTDIKKFSLKRIKQELIARGADSSGSKAEVTERLRAMTSAGDTLCSGSRPGVALSSPSLSPTDTPSACTCKDAGIPCHPQVCRCAKYCCGNPCGVDAYDAVSVKTFRRDILSLTKSPSSMLSPLSSPSSALDAMPPLELNPCEDVSAGPSCSPVEIGRRDDQPPTAVLSH